YSTELASSGRAGCKSVECKKAGTKIDKGELRFGVLVTIQDHQSWTWRHWGCTTPVQIAHLKDESGGDTDMVDGYDELPAELQEKVRTALEVGHVADEDWRGVSPLEPFTTSISCFSQIRMSR
ncbi:zf-PARP-domain-containing protein, partial [Delitschia confertaspora ATCC 74209]